MRGPATGVLLVTLLLVASTAPALPPAGAVGDPPALDEGLARAIALDPVSPRDVLVSFAGGAGAHEAARLSALGLQVDRVFPRIGVAHAVGPGAAVARAALDPGVARIVPNAPLEWYLSTATVATRARDAWDARSTSATPLTVSGEVVDGRGVGIAVVDTDVDWRHPDLAGAVASHRRYAGAPAAPSSAAPQPLPLSLGCVDALWSTAGAHVGPYGDHGTHVAGIAAGRGVASAGRHVGAAPGASIHAFAVGFESAVLAGLEALQWVACHHATTNPPIRVVTNSWGLNASFDPEHPINRAVDDLVAEGVLVVWAGGNSGGNLKWSTLNAWARNPTPGVLAVANYHDGETGTRTGLISTTSSRGAVADPARAWPDLAAPGTLIVAPVPSSLFAYSPLAYGPYAVKSGTSMAAPHVAGVAALVLQAAPWLSPAEVEDILEDSARALPTADPWLADPTNPTTLASPSAGHGLVDAVAALNDPRVGLAGAGSPQPQVSGSPRLHPLLSAQERVVREGAVDPQAQSGGIVRWTTVAGETFLLREERILTGDAAAWPVAAGQAAAFRFDCPWDVQVVAAPIVAAFASVEMEARHALGGPGQLGECRGEALADFGAGLVAFDSFSILVLPTRV